MVDVPSRDMRCSARRSDEEQGSSVIFTMRIVGLSLAAHKPILWYMFLDPFPRCRASVDWVVAKSLRRARVRSNSGTS